MNKRYIDFVPANSAKTKVVRRGQAAPRVVHAELPKKTVNRAPAPRPNQVIKKTAVSTARVVELKPASKVIKKPVMRKETSLKVEPKHSTGTVPALGVIEDLNSRKANTELPKRPLGSSATVSASEVKAKKVKAEGLFRKNQKPEEFAKKPATNKASTTYKAPNSPFINQSKVEKRPLSKNVYQKKIAVPKEEPKGPVTIISKPEKDSHVGIIVTIIMTIILGATAGTVAFLLLPK